VVTDPLSAFDALGDPQRREILRLLGEGDKPVHVIAQALPLSIGGLGLREGALVILLGLVAENTTPGKPSRQSAADDD